MKEFNLKWGPDDSQAYVMHKKVIVDSGTSFLLLPRDDLDNLLAEITAKTQMNFLMDIIPYAWCSEEQYNKFPDMQFTIDGNVYFLPK